MKIKNILIFVILIFSLSISAFAIESYDKGDIVPISAQYTFGGVLSEANATLTVTFPNGTIDLPYNELVLNSPSTGIFTGQYNATNITGRYKALVIFYNGTTELGRDLQFFEIGDTTFKLGDSFTENKFSIIFLLIICIGLYLLQLVFNVPITGLIGGFGIILLSISFFAYSPLFGLIILLLGVVVTIHSMTLKQ